MKKIFCAVLALAAMASCSKEYIVAENKQAIAFGEAFVDNGTRADYSQTNKPVTEFLVYGTLKGTYNTVQIYDEVLVKKPTNEYFNNGVYVSTEAWLCTADPQYWVPNAEYNFAAIVDGVAEDTTALPEEIKFTVKDGTDNKDLLYAEATASVDNNGAVTGLTNNMVAFSFKHLLSKVMFTVNGNIGAGYSIKVTDISVTGAKKDGLYTIADTFENSNWVATSEDTVPSLTFGTTDEITSTNSAVASATRQILPVEQTLNVTIS